MNSSELINLAESLGLTDPEVILVGDGSGTVVSKPGGWSVVGVVVKSGEVFHLSGAMSNATNNLMEIMPYVHALWFLQSRRLTFRKGGVISDSEISVKIGSGQAIPSANLLCWQMWNWLVQQSRVDMQWRWMGRNSHPIHAQVDARSREARLSFSAFLEAGVVDENKNLAPNPLLR